MRHQWTLPEHLSSPPVLSGVRIARSFVFCVMYCGSLDILFVLFFIWPLHCSILSVPDEDYSRNAPCALNLISAFLLYIFDMWLMITIWYLQTFVTNACDVLFLGPMVSALCNRYSHRTVVMWSGIVLGFSAMSSAFAPNLYFLFLSYGVIGGNIYNQTCIKRSPLGQRKTGLIRQVTS